MTDPPAFQFFTEVAIIEHLSRTAAERVMPPGLSMAGFSVLNHLARMGPTQAPAQIASAMQVTKGAMTGTLKRLEAEGLVQIEPDPKDGRGKAVTVTPAGMDARNDAIRALGPLFADLFRAVDPRAVEGVLPVLREIRAHLDAARDRDGA